jgi:hypothetical protein
MPHDDDINSDEHLHNGVYHKARNFFFKKEDVKAIIIYFKYLFIISILFSFFLLCFVLFEANPFNNRLLLAFYFFSRDPFCCIPYLVFPSLLYTLRGFTKRGGLARLPS